MTIDVQQKFGMVRRLRDANGARREDIKKDGNISVMFREESGQAVAEFSLVVLLLMLVLFATLEAGLLLNDKMVLTSTAREVARVCAVEGGRTAGALERLNSLLTSSGIAPASVEANIYPTQAIYGTTIYVDLSYDYIVKSPLVRALAGSQVRVTTSAITRSEFVPR